MIKNWKEFNFKEVFDYTRGQRLVIADQIPGEIPYISSTKTNNGIDNYITPPTWMTVFNNKIGLNNSGSIGYCFYHNYDFVASDHVTVLDIAKKYNKQLTLNIALFLIPIIQKLAPRYGFAREMNNDKLSREIIMLPQDKNGNPDWQFMENYINEVGKKAVWNNKNIIQSRPYQKVDTSKWKEFSIGDKRYFSIKRGNPIHKNAIDYGDMLYITRTGVNNGYECGIDCDIKYINKGNMITIGGEGCIAFYQNEDCFTGNNINIIRYNKINKYNAMFLISIINYIVYKKYSYGYSVAGDRLKEIEVKLPATKTCEPDWQFMEDYIKSLPYSNCLEKYE